MVALVSGAAGTVAATALTVQDAEAVEMSEVVPAGNAEVAGTAEVAGEEEAVGTAEVAEEEEAVGTVEVAEEEEEAAGTVEVVEAFVRQLLCATAGGAAWSQVSAECFVVPAPFSGAGLLRGHAAEPVVFLPTPVLQ